MESRKRDFMRILIDEAFVTTSSSSSGSKASRSRKMTNEWQQLLAMPQASSCSIASRRAGEQAVFTPKTSIHPDSLRPAPLLDI